MSKIKCRICGKEFEDTLELISHLIEHRRERIEKEKGKYIFWELVENRIVYHKK